MIPIGITRRIVRIEDELLRCIAWTCWFPVSFLRLALFIAPMRAWFTPRFWEVAGMAWTAGIQGFHQDGAARE